jgi:hypothetical protein
LLFSGQDLDPVTPEYERRMPRILHQSFFKTKYYWHNFSLQKYSLFLSVCHAARLHGQAMGLRNYIDSSNIVSIYAVIVLND